MDQLQRLYDQNPGIGANQLYTKSLKEGLAVNRRVVEDFIRRQGDRDLLVLDREQSRLRVNSRQWDRLARLLLLRRRHGGGRPRAPSDVRAITGIFISVSVVLAVEIKRAHGSSFIR